MSEPCVNAVKQNMGRIQQPRELAELKGAVKHDPQRYKAEVPKNPSPVGPPPAHMGESAKAIWFELEAYALPGGNIETYYDLVCASEGIHTLNMTWVSGGKVCVMGVEPLYTPKKSVTICNAGFDGSKTSDWTYANFSGFSAFYIAQKYTPDLIVLSLGANDWISSVSVDTYRANLLSLVTWYMLNSDVIVIGPEPTSNGGIPLATQRNYIEAARSVALEKGVPFVNLHERFVSAENARDVGLFNTDLTHNTGAGYADVASVLASMLISV